MMKSEVHSRKSTRSASLDPTPPQKIQARPRISPPIGVCYRDHSLKPFPKAGRAGDFRERS